MTDRLLSLLRALFALAFLPAGWRLPTFALLGVANLNLGLQCSALVNGKSQFRIHAASGIIDALLH
ncbi:MAG TPA: hypothetical protein PLZ36_07875, partial [Armatimonadota bacterium]|nr:hypothetical protein [Armatimonadota bacterium]